MKTKALAQFNYEVSPVRKDGFCFILALQECLVQDHAMNISVNDIKTLLESEIYENNYVYKNLYEGMTKQMLNTLDKYLLNGDWSQSIVDVAVFAVANCLAVNLLYLKTSRTVHCYSLYILSGLLPKTSS